MLASDFYDLISLAINNDNLTSEQKWELVNSRAGMYLNNYVPKDKVFPKHVMKELEEMRKSA